MDNDMKGIQQNQSWANTPTLAKEFKDSLGRIKEYGIKEQERINKLPRCKKCNKPVEENLPCQNCIRIAVDEAEKRQRKEEAIGRDIIRLGGIRAYKDFTKERFTQKETLNLCSSYPKENLFLYGAAGTGKTHLAVALIREYPDGYLYKPQDIFRSLRGHKEEGEEEALLYSYANENHMVIDDFGTEKKTDFSFSCIYEILDRRWMNFKTGLIITSNLTLDALAVRLGDDRIISRIVGMCRIIKLEGKDRRL